MILYRKFGKTGVDVSALGFGTMQLPIIGGKFEYIDKKNVVLHEPADNFKANITGIVINNNLINVYPIR